MEIIKKAYNDSLAIGTRSARRTDCIHNGIGDAATSIRPDLTYKIEQVFPTHIGTYSVDVTLYKDGKLALFILVKAPLCNIKQNETNTQNSCIGEIVKLYKSYKDVPIIMFDFLPMSCPYYDKDGNVKKMEKFVIADIREKTKKYIQLTDPFDLGTPMLTGRFIMFTNLTQTTKKDIIFDGFEDASDFDAFADIVRKV